MMGLSPAMSGAHVQAGVLLLLRAPDSTGTRAHMLGLPSTCQETSLAARCTAQPYRLTRLSKWAGKRYGWQYICS